MAWCLISRVVKEILRNLTKINLLLLSLVCDKNYGYNDFYFIWLVFHFFSIAYIWFIGFLVLSVTSITVYTLYIRVRALKLH